MKNTIYRILEQVTPPVINGNGAKGLLIVLEDSDKQENIDTLKGLVKAIKYDFEEDVTVISCLGDFTPLNTILSSKKYNTIILIGTTPNQIGFSINAKKNFFYKMENFEILLADSLRDMNADKSKKLAFWQNLQDKFLS